MVRIIETSALEGAHGSLMDRTIDGVVFEKEVYVPWGRISVEYVDTEEEYYLPHVVSLGKPIKEQKW